MSVYKNLMKVATDLNTLADTLDKTADSAASGVNAQLQKAASMAKQASEAAAAVPKGDPEVKVQLGQLAKQASAHLLGAGLLSSQDKADQFASRVLDHKTALQQLAKLAHLVQNPVPLGKAAEQVAVAEEETADERWNKRASTVLETLNLGF
jgi:hypothetical protein